MRIKLFAALVAVVLAACAKSEAPSVAGNAPNAKPITINGAGATFPYPIYSKWFSDYNKIHPEILINYQSIGSGGGIKQMTAQTVFFGATDGPMTDEQLKGAPGPVLHFPTVLGAVVPAYNVPNVTAELKFSGPLLADIYLGKVKKWNDAAIGKANPGVTLPNLEITVVHRSEGSGTNYIFCDFLSKVSPEFKQRVGVATSVKWPVGVGAKGNEGVTGMVRQIPGAIGYVELIYAKQNGITYGAVQNAAGEYLRASLESMTAAAASAAASMPADFRVSITNAAGKGAYPISSFTWILLYQNPTDKQRGKVMVDFMKWALTDGQKDASPLGYAPLPKEVIDLETQALQKIQL
ncbi:MAG: phosphate ABC transporter substrate-binding protein PstS [Acidobacteriota bacterium]|nr:phosphate ABC transporter substrate-binding protein PstS [Acidobacteriota bacterium]